MPVHLAFDSARGVGNQIVVPSVILAGITALIVFLVAYGGGSAVLTPTPTLILTASGPPTIGPLPGKKATIAPALASVVQMPPLFVPCTI